MEPRTRAFRDNTPPLRLLLDESVGRPTVTGSALEQVSSSYSLYPPHGDELRLSFD